MKKNPNQPLARVVGRFAFGIRRGFTLIEILIVLAIISLVVGLGVPVFNLLTGAKSVEAGRNVVSAALGQARTIAVNEGKYAGVMFYIDPATEQTAMSIVIIADPRSGLEDADPYDKYKTWIVGQQYEAAVAKDPTTDAPIRGDRVISLAADADATYRAPLYSVPSAQWASEYLKYFGNYRPTVKTFRSVKQLISGDNAGNRPPRNGPYPANAQQYPGNNSTSGSTPTFTAESSAGSFGNGNWELYNQNIIEPAASGEKQLLPKGIGLQVVIQPTQRAGMTGTDTERYLRTGILMFDPQGRLYMQKAMALATDNTLGGALALTANAQQIVCGVGVVLYQDAAFKDAVSATGNPTTNSDFLYQAVAGNAYGIRSKYTNLFADQPNVTSFVAEKEEETWLDNNTTPLLVNRYTGSLSATD